MYYHSAKVCLVSVLLILSTRFRASAARKKKTPERKPELSLPTVTCSARGIKAVFDALVKNNVHVRDLTGATVPVSQSEWSCGMKLGKDNNRTSVFSRYDSCYTQVEGNKVVVPLHVQQKQDDRWIRVNISCPLIKRRSERTQMTPSSPPAFPGNCDTEQELRLDCGPQHISGDACLKIGCCYDDHDSHCYYRLDACSLDGHFVFSVKATDSHPPIDPSNLIIKNQPHCFPAVTTTDTAVFKIGVMECGATMKFDGDALIYEVEVEEIFATSKHSPFSLQVQCDYALSDLTRAQDLRSFKSVTNPPPVVAVGNIRVQMRIATDPSFTSFIPEDQLPLTLPLREAVNVEISIVQPSPDPSLSLRVRDCFAYPVSRHSVWTLLFDGCPNPLDNMGSSVPVDKMGKATSHSQVRRFDVKTFAFLEPHTGHASAEKMYFYCWVEICTPDADCAQHCTIISSEGERHRREAGLDSNQVQLVSIGPLVQNGEEPDDNACETQKIVYQMAVYTLTSVLAALLLILLCIAWSNIKRRQETEELRACDAQSQ
ncbi:zona pellucida sperm-binding protein 4-like [Salarias fasciatus]|uniref:zona pellucida sperm-binding protein 4-like n=1 Tax=Salarias fasciatus TaxID=181472 RepID=UPI001176818C|nr:zona pellucida sperm-binding protein 4-like [Salarias fasciatus]